MSVADLVEAMPEALRRDSRPAGDAEFRVWCRLRREWCAEYDVWMLDLLTYERRQRLTAARSADSLEPSSAQDAGRGHNHSATSTRRRIT